MSSHRFWMVGGCGLWLLTAPVQGDPPVAAQACNMDAAQALAVRIDQLIAARWTATKTVPAPAADDAEFLRRVYLDIAGRIPSVSDARVFLTDKAPDKRRRLVDRLLDGPGYVNHFANIWKTLLAPEANADFTLRYYFLPGLESWVQKQFAANVPYDKMVRDLLTAPAGIDQQRFFGPFGARTGEAVPVAFYLTKDVKPENLAASTARLFLGIKLECAQCHNHPFARWTRAQFWEYAAFFAGLNKQGEGPFSPVREISDRRELPIPGASSGTTQVVQAAFLDGSEPRWQYKVSSRETLAHWLTAPDNPYFARAAVNRMWAHFLGTGLVEPVDDLSESNPPSHPELLTDLAREFAGHAFDLKFLIRAVTSSKTYQLTSTATHPSQEEPRLFLRMAVKGMSPEQLFDSIAQATGYRADAAERNPFVFNNNNTPRTDFLAKFSHQDKRTEFQTSILQALGLMNGKFVADATNLEKSQTLAAVLDAPFLDTPGRIETLFLATLARKPKPEEADRFLKYVNSGGVKKNSKAALGDVFWALLNSSEFLLNH